MKKKIIGLLFLVTIFTSTSHAIPPHWFREVFGCSWNWSGPAVLKLSVGNWCSYDRPMSGHSWLWGDCGTESYSYTIPCADDPDFFPLPIQQYEESNRVMIARKMTELELLGYPIKSEWKNVHELQNKTILTEAVIFRLSLAGYTYDPEWENLEMEPCPVPSPTQEIKIPQSYTFINAECNQSLSIFPNPNGGTFTLLIPNYKDVVSLEIIRDLDMSMIYSKFQAFVNESEPISLSSPLPGYYTIRVRTLTGTIYSKLLIQ